MRTSMKKLLAICAAFVLLLGCAPLGSDLTGGRLPITVSIRPHAWLVREIGGPHIEVQTLVSPGDSPHSYQPSDAQISRLMASRAFFRTGVPFERGPWFEALQSAGSVRIVDLREGIELRKMESSVPHGETHAEQDHSGPGDRHAAHEPADEHDHHAAGSTAHDHNQDHDHGHLHAGLDPHIWLSPRLLKHQAQTVASVLQELNSST
jgi:zinc transport system substrate-binding protein